MKKALALLLLTTSLWALPVGNPQEANLLTTGVIWMGTDIDSPCAPYVSWCDLFNFRIGFYGSYVFNRHMEIKLTDDVLDVDVERVQLFTNAGYFVVNFWECLDLFATLGASNLYLATNIHSFDPLLPSFPVTVETDTSFSWSVGSRYSIIECGCMMLGIEAEYFQTTPRIRSLYIGGEEGFYPACIAKRYHEWQVGLGLAARLSIFSPYIAVKYSRAHWDFHEVELDGLFVPDLKSGKHWGGAVGVSLLSWERAALTVEERFGDEKALYVNGQVRF